MPRKNTKLETLARVPLFKGCTKRELRQIASIADELDLPAGKTLAKEGTRGREFVVLVDGTADVRRRGRRINTLGAGDFLGEIALVTGRPRTATVTTTSPSRVLVLTSRAFRTLLRDDGRLAGKVLLTLASRLPER